jgi:hypothetical protein
MKSIGSLLVILGIVAIIFGFMERVPTVLSWIYEWGDGPAWAIKIGLIVVGAIIYILGARQTGSTTTPPKA